MRLVPRVSGLSLWLAGFTVVTIVWATVASGTATADGGDQPAAKQAAEAKDSADAKKPAEPAHRVIACYFHRTVRCATCQKISAYIEEAVKEKLAAEVKDGRVKMVMIDFQDAKNQQYTDSYQITGPTLVVMDVHDGKVKAWKAAPKVWALVGNKKAFLQYVEEEVRSYLDEKKP